MIEKSTTLPIWMLLAAAFGFMAGAAYGQGRHRKSLEQANNDLRDQLRQGQAGPPAIRRALDQQRSVINDIHKRVVAVTKGLEKRPS